MVVAFIFGNGELPVDIGLGVVAAAILVGGLVLLQRKEREYARRADEKLGAEPLAGLE